MYSVKPVVLFFLILWLIRRKVLLQASSILEVAIVRHTAAISFPGIKLKVAKTRELAFADREASGGVNAISEVYDHHAPALYRLLFAMLGRTADAEDALQEVFVKLARKSERGTANSTNPVVRAFDKNDCADVCQCTQKLWLVRRGDV